MILNLFATGQLGNRLIQRCHLLAFCLEHHVRMWDVGMCEYADLFEFSRHDCLGRYPPPAAGCRLPWPRRWTMRACRKSAHLARRLGVPTRRFLLLTDGGEYLDLQEPSLRTTLIETGLVAVYAYRFRCTDYVNKHAEQLRHWFRPVETHARRVDPIRQRLRDGIDCLVGVHIRHGDFKEFSGGQFFFDASAYAGFMRTMNNLLAPKRVRFLVCSNAEQNPAAFAGLDAVLQREPAIIDMLSLASCDYLIGPPSTFSRWASFYGNVPMRIVSTPESAIELERFHVSMP